MQLFNTDKPTNFAALGHTVTIEQAGTWELLQKVVTFPYRFAEETYKAYLAAREALTPPRNQSTSKCLEAVFIRFPCNIVTNLYKTYYLPLPLSKTINSPEVAKALLKYPRNDPHGPLIQKQSPFLNLARKLYPEINSDDLLFSCTASFVDLYRKPLMEMMKPGAIREQRAALKDLAKELIQKESGTIDANHLALLYSTAVVSKLILGHPGPIATYEAIGEFASFLLNGPKNWEELTPLTVNSSATLTGAYGIAIDISHLEGLKGEAYSQAKAQAEAELNDKIAQFKAAREGKQTLSLETLRRAVETSLASPLAEKLRSENRLNEMQIKSTILALYFAGSETASSLLTYLLWQLGQHPEWQEGTVSTKSLYAEAIRLFTPAPEIPREASDDLVCKVKDQNGNEVYREIIPKGTSFFYSISNATKNYSQYQLPDTFDPERFTTVPNPLPWLPFGSGHHICPGQWLAEAEIIAFVDALMETYTIKSLPDETLSTERCLTSRPSEKVTLSLQKRKQE